MSNKAFPWSLGTVAVVVPAVIAIVAIIVTTETKTESGSPSVQGHSCTLLVIGRGMDTTGSYNIHEARCLLGIPSIHFRQHFNLNMVRNNNGADGTNGTNANGAVGDYNWR